MEQIINNKKVIRSIFLPTSFTQRRSANHLYFFSQKGFSLLEVLIVIGIIVIISAIAVPNMAVMMKSYRLNSAANEMASVMQLARMTAIGQNANSVLTFNTGNQTYSAFSDNGNGGGTINDGIQTGTEPTIKMVNIASAYSGEVTFSTPSFGATLTFNSQGSCNPSGTVSLQNSIGKVIQVIISSSGSIKTNKLY
ncbi:MAG: GspH/FimT family protein [Thermodesulfobacteriota bacterium]|jgi:prepilin-type N-terminal cleavage/methylation domain-containing protein